MEKQTGPATVSVPARLVKSAVKSQPLVQERRDKLIAAAVAVFKEKGFHATTIRDIGRKARMTQGNIYNYVSCKDDILYLVCDRLISEYQEETRKALQAKRDPADRIGSAARAVAEVIYKHQDEILVIYQNTYLLDARSLRIILTRVDQFAREFDKLIAAAAREAKVKIANTYLAAHLFTFVPTMIALRRWAVGRELSREELISGVTQFIVKGLGFGN